MKVALFKVCALTLLFLSNIAFGQCTINIVSPDAICDGESLALEAIPNAGSNVISWSQGGNPIGPTGTNPVNVSPTNNTSTPITVTYTVTLTDPNNGCNNSTDFVVTVLPTPNVSITNFNMCPNDPPVPFFWVTDAELPIHFVTNDPAVDMTSGNNINTFRFDPSIHGPGVYVINVANDHGCSVDVTFKVVDLVPFVPAGLVCTSTHPFVMFPINPSANCGNYSYHDTPPGITPLGPAPPYIDEPDNEFDPAIAGPGTHTFTICFNSCFGNVDCCEEYTIVVESSPSMSIVVNSPLCEGNDIDISATNTSQFKCTGATWQWYENSTGSPLPIPAPNLPGTPDYGQLTNHLQVPANTYPVGTEFSLELCCGNGCCTTLTAGTIQAYPTVTLAAIAPIDLCSWDGTPVQLSATGNGNSCGFTGPGVNPQTGMFNPAVAGVGQHLVSYWCNTNGCIGRDEQVIEVTDEGFWHQTTINSEWRESATDVVTDYAGNVYMTGYYIQNTTFMGSGGPNTTLVSSNGAPGNQVTNSYVVKYDACGTVLWVASTENTGIGNPNNSSSIVYDQINDLVYVGGSFESEIKFNGANGSSNTLASGSNEFKGYVACFDGTSGNVNYQHLIDPGFTNDVSALAISESNGDLFVGGTNRATSGAPRKILVAKYDPQSFWLGPIQAVIFPANNTQGDQWLADMDFDESSPGGRSLWLTGKFQETMQFLGGAYLANSGNNTTDAFVARFIDNGTNLNEAFNLQGNGGFGGMSGDGIVVNEDDHLAYVTGGFRGSINNIFSLGQFLPGQNNLGAYIVAFEPAGGAPWPVKRGVTVSNQGYVSGTSIAYENGIVNATGVFTESAVSFTGISGTAPYTGANSPGAEFSHVYVVSYDAASGAGNWLNGTEDCNLTNGYNSSHLAEAICIDQSNHAFVVGSYTGCMTYLNGNPASGDLVSSPAGLGNVNSFAMRVDVPTGSFKNQELVDEVKPENSKILNEKTNLQLTLAPNPTTNQTLLRVVEYNPDFTYNYSLLGIDGKVIQQGNIDVNGATIDLNNYQAGVYFVQVSNGTEMEVAKILKVE